MADGEPEDQTAALATGHLADKVVVPFSGPGSGSAELTWGQQTVWRGIEAKGAPMWLLGNEPTPPGATVQDIADLLAYIMGRHQSMRTMLAFPDGEPIRQVVSESGEIELEVHDVDDGADALAYAKALELSWLEWPLDYTTQWPVRMAVVRQHGVPAHRVTAMNHLVTDGFGVMAYLADLDARDPVSNTAPGPVTAMEPLEEARWQASPAGQRRTGITEKYWERMLREIPASRFQHPAEAPEPHCWHLTFESPAAYLAIQAIGARTEVDTSPVVLAAFAVALARVTGINPAVLRVYVNNRFRPRLANAVSPIAQTCPCVIDVADATFDEAVSRAYYASLTAYKNAYFVPVRIRTLLAQASAERGEDIDLNLVYNDRRMGSPREAAGSVPSAADIAAALPRTKLKIEESPPGDFCHIHVMDSPDTLSVLVAFTNDYVSRADVERLLHEVESLVVAAAFDPAVPTGVG